MEEAGLWFSPGASNPSESPRRCQLGSTSPGGASLKLRLLASSDLNASYTTYSFSIACMLHVEYTILRTRGTAMGISLSTLSSVKTDFTDISWRVLLP